MWWYRSTRPTPPRRSPRATTGRVRWPTSWAGSRPPVSSRAWPGSKAIWRSSRRADSEASNVRSRRTPATDSVAKVVGGLSAPDLPPDFFNRPLSEVDPEIAEVLANELERQQRTLEMIASENFVPMAVLECQGLVLTNKYAEGYPGKRYYGRCEHVDVAERLAIQRALDLFGAEHANVQPHSGAQANIAVYHALLQPGDTVMGLELSHGGHLTHGMRINVSGRLYDIAPYHVDRETGRIDMDEVQRIAHERRP